MRKWNHYKLIKPSLKKLKTEIENKDQAAIFKFKDEKIEHGKILVFNNGIFVKINDDLKKYGCIKNDIAFIILLDDLKDHEYSQKFWTNENKFKFKKFYDSKTDLKIIAEIMYIYS